MVDRQTRSRMMAGIRGKDTKPEMIVRRYLHARGFRYRLHDKRLPGKPDLVFPRYRTVLFVHGCFWHQHPGCRFATTPTPTLSSGSTNSVATKSVTLVMAMPSAARAGKS